MCTLEPRLPPCPPFPGHLQSFATYLLIAWLTSNIIFAKIVSIVCALEWEVGVRWYRLPRGHRCCPYVLAAPVRQAAMHVPISAPSLLTTHEGAVA